MSRLERKNVSGVDQAINAANNDVSQRPRSLLLAFLALQLLVLFALLPTIFAGGVLGDLELYRQWAERGLKTGEWMGIEQPWVYPILASVPIVLAAIGGPALYQLLWYLLTMALNGLAIAVLTDWGRSKKGYPAAWWWLLVSFILSPVGQLRLEGIVAPLVIIALLLLAKRPFVAGILLAIATWIKVWPIAVLAAIIGAGKRGLTVLVSFLLASLAVVATVVSLGGLGNLLSFVGMQAGRGLQLEAPITTPWVWMAALNRPGSYIYQNTVLATREVIGTGSAEAAALMTPLLLLVLAAIFGLVLLARRRTTDHPQLVLYAALALSTALIVFNKVGSPQYILWIAPIVVAGLAVDVQRWRAPSSLVLTISVLTTLIFPIFYMPLADGNIAAVMLLTARNLLLVCLLGWSLWVVSRMAFSGQELNDDRSFVRSTTRQPADALAQLSAASAASAPPVSGGK